MSRKRLVRVARRLSGSYHRCTVQCKLSPFLGVAVAVLMLLSCIAIPEGDGIPQRLTDIDDASVDGMTLVDVVVPPLDATNELLPADPHAVFGVNPSHGPYIGGRLVAIRGNGFASSARVWFGGTEVPKQDVTAADPTRIQVLVPPGDPGPVGVRVQNADDESTSRTLAGAYTYDALYAEPSSGPTSGGTIMVIRSKGTHWTSLADVRVANTSCRSMNVLSPTEIECVTPPQPAGSVSVSVAMPDEEPVVVYDAFVYSDSDNGFKGGLSGAPLSGVLKVGVYDSWYGEPIRGATVIAGDNLDSAIVAQTSSSGVAVLNDSRLVGTRSVTVAKHCYQPATFIDVPVDTVTVYVAPIQTAECIFDFRDGGGIDSPIVGGKPVVPATINGELLWEFSGEFRRGTWSNVPEPIGDNEERVAYIYLPYSDPTTQFAIPSVSRMVFEDASGSLGYEFNITVSPGNITLYVLAGIQNKSTTPNTFTAFSMGITRGIAAKPGETTRNVYVDMMTPLDQAITLRVEPPTPGPKGPDRLVSSVAVRLGNDAYAILPGAQRSTMISGIADITFVGLPGLTGSLHGTQFITSTKAVTGTGGGAPAAIVGRYLSTDASLPVHVDGFVQVPVLESPGVGEPFDGRHLVLSRAPGGARIDVTIVRLIAASGFIEWLIAAPGARTAIELPDITAFNAALPKGALTIYAYGGHASDNSIHYESLVYRQMDTRGWTAYSYDMFNRFHGGP